MEEQEKKEKNSPTTLETIEVIPKIEDEISVIENIIQNSLKNTHEDINGLILKANNVNVDINDKSSYDSAVKLKKEIKTTHVSLKKKKENFKKPFSEFSKRIEDYTKTYYEPLKNAENILVGKIKPYELNQEKIKLDAKIKQEDEENKKKEIENKLFELNSTLSKVNICKTKSEVVLIESSLKEIDLKSFGDRSHEAGFIVQNLLMTCVMFKNSLPETLVEDTIEEVIKEDVLTNNESNLSVSLPNNNSKKTNVLFGKIDLGNISNQLKIDENKDIIDNTKNISVEKEKVEVEVEVEESSFDKPVNMTSLDLNDNNSITNSNLNISSKVIEDDLKNDIDIDFFGTLKTDFKEKQESEKINSPNNIISKEEEILENDSYLIELIFSKSISPNPISIRLTNKESGEVITYEK